MKKIYLLAVALAGTLLTSCSDFLDKVPLVVPSSETFLTNQSAVTNYVNGLYIALPSAGAYGMGIMGEEKNSDNMVAMVYDRRMNGELQESIGGVTEWQKGYQNLRSVNYFLEYHKGTDFAAAEYKSDDFLQQVLTLGDELFQMGITLNTKENDKSVKNIDDAYGNLFNSKDLSATQEVLFWKKYSIADNLVHSLNTNLSSGMCDAEGPAGLSQSLVDNYLSVDGNFIDPTAAKFKDFNESFKDRDGRLLATVMHSDCKYKSMTVKGAKKMLVKAYSEEDKDLINPPQIVSTGNQSNTTGYHIRMGIDTTFVSGQGETATPMIRYAEALLAYAEAAEELGKCDAAVLEKTIKPLRERAGVTYLAPSAIDPNFPDFGYTISANLQEIRRERRSELPLQGMRLDDLMRWRAHKLFQGKRGGGAYFGAGSVLYKSIDPKNEELAQILVDNNDYLDPLKNVLPRGFQFDAGRDYLLPIPPSEISLNKELTQNPGWRKN